jgi:hypothetical protein
MATSLEAHGSVFCEGSVGRVRGMVVTSPFADECAMTVSALRSRLAENSLPAFPFDTISQSSSLRESRSATSVVLGNFDC